MSPFIRLRENLIFNLEDVESNIIPFPIIAHSLAGLPRFNRNIPITYTVGQHILAGVRYLTSKGDFKTAKYFLLHETDEMVLGDIPGPVKKLFPDVEDYASRIRDHFYKLNGLNPHDPIIQQVKFVDSLMLLNEYQNFFPNTPDAWINLFGPEHYKAWPVTLGCYVEDSQFIEDELIRNYEQLWRM